MVRNIKQRLVQITPGRTLETGKEVRKSTRYQELLASLQPEAKSSELIEREPVSPDPGSPNDLPDYTTPDPSPNEWAVEVRTTIEQLGIPDGIDIDDINPGLVNNHTRDMLDAEYVRWLPPLAGPNRRPPRRRSGAPRVRTGLPASTVRARRRTHPNAAIFQTIKESLRSQRPFQYLGGATFPSTDGYTRATLAWPISTGIHA